MFVETNDIESVIVNIDGLIKIDGDRLVDPRFIIRNSEIDSSRIAVENDVNQTLAYLVTQYHLQVVSSLFEGKIRSILRRCFNLPPEVDVFPATDSTEQFILKRPMTRALFSSGTKPCNSVYLCGDTGTIFQAQSLRIGTIFWDHPTMDDSERAELLEKGPDFIINTGQQLIDVFEKRYLGYLGEVLSTPGEFFGSTPDNTYVEILAFPNREFPSFSIQVSGRYFRKNDPRNRKHALSLRILNSKNYMERHKRIFSLIIGHMILHVVGDEFDYLTRVPPKPGEEEDRLKEQIQYIPTMSFGDKRISTDKIRADLLRCGREYIPQKEIGDYEARRENVRAAFEVTDDVNGKSVIVIDDIVTSGSTLMEITKMLHEAGAKRIVPMALSYHPENLSPTREILNCRECGEELVPRHRKEDGSPFYGCPNYFKTNCKGLLEFSSGVRELNERIELEELEPFEDIEF